MKILLLIILACASGLTLFYQHGRSVWVPLSQKVVGKKTVLDVVNMFGAQSRSRLRPYFNQVKQTYPPKQITLLAIKDEAILELWVGSTQNPTYIRSYDIKGLSGVAGPKLREGDRQVPEGIYQIEGFNPNSSYHLSMKVNYPNAFDLKYAQQEGRDRPGTNIFIHGKTVSIGCLAMGDPTIEELFILAADVGREHINLIIAPTDPRKNTLNAKSMQPWVKTLYEQIEKAYRPYQRIPS